ncbi:hypothetical protein ACN38_g1324 [Penicillium nordicum]|uniref:Uncharacterized protein n=1 Tax=Penicillium nordicum TaxID=229535 RepID=A0A0M8P8W3_9EURO|nr:hypothetical protein ACN38_g1324 [Penicillium nordicum]
MRSYARSCNTEKQHGGIRLCADGQRGEREKERERSYGRTSYMGVDLSHVGPCASDTQAPSNYLCSYNKLACLYCLGPIMGKCIIVLTLVAFLSWRGFPAG